MKSDHVSTKNMPEITSFLHRHAPEVLCTECFNDHNVPFSEEVKNTELGHLFEHLVLADLCAAVSKARGEYTVSAVTDWDWDQNPRGSFSLTFDIDVSDSSLLQWFQQAVQRCAQLLDQLLQSSRPSCPLEPALALSQMPTPPCGGVAVP